MSIRKELGKDAVILSTKKIRVKKWLGLRWQTRLEVTAAIGGDIPLHHRDVERSAKSHASQESQWNTGGEAVAATAEKMSKPVNEVKTNAVKAPEDFGTALASAFTAYETASKAVTPASGGELQSILQELTTLKSMVVEQGERRSRRGHVRHPLERFLERQGLTEEQSKELALELSQVFKMVGADDDVSKVIPLIAKRLGTNEVPRPIAAESKIAAFIGPTGVGKTTTIAKIAALHVLAGQRHIGLLTTDTYRIAAVQQLQTYADILDIPFVVADGEDAIPGAIAELSGCDLILVDTAGHNFRDEKSIQATNRLLQALCPDECILVVSLTAKPEDADAVVSACLPLDVHKLLFTKLDETDTYGTVPRLMLKYDLPLSYITTGQNVPDDIDMRALTEVLSVWAGGDKQ